MKTDLVIVAAGSGLRMGRDKMFLPVGNDLLLFRTLSVFAERKEFQHIIVVLKSGNEDYIPQIEKEFPNTTFLFAVGGKTRAQSVLNGLKLSDADVVLVHDGARPFVSPALVDEILENAARYGSAVPVLPMQDSIRVKSGDELTATADRATLYRVQTPQAFPRKALVSALSNHPDSTDESEAMLRSDFSPHCVKGEEKNLKVTDIGTYFGLNSKIGTGFDVHRLAYGYSLVLGGITLDYEKGAIAHSDGDALIHALIDALYSAVGERDIGTHYPDTDKKYRDIDSTLLLSDTMEYYRAHNVAVSNVSCTIFLEQPKLSEFIPLMQVKLGHIMGISPSQISIAAKTGEGLGAIGQGEAVAASVIVCVTM